MRWNHPLAALVWCLGGTLIATPGLAQSGASVIVAPTPPEPGAPMSYGALMSTIDVCNNVTGMYIVEGQLNACQQLLRENSPRVDPAQVYGVLGAIYIRTERDAEARDAFSQAIALRPEWAAAYVGRGRALLLQQDFVGARADLYRALQLEPHNHEAWLLRARAFYLEDNSEGARRDIDAILSGDASDTVKANALVLRANINLRDDEPEYALDDLYRAQAYDAANPDIEPLINEVLNELDD